MVLIANPGKIPDRTPGDFGCREDFDRKEFCFPSQIPATLPPRYPVARQESRQDSRRDPAEILAAGIPLPAKNPGKIPTGILPRFWPPGIPSPAKNPGKIPAGIPPRFWPPGIPPPAKNPGKIPAGIPPRFWPLGIPPPAKNPGKIPAGIPPRFWPPGIPPSRQESRYESRREPIPAAKISAGSRRESCRDLGKIPPRSRYHFYKGSESLGPPNDVTGPQQRPNP